VRVAATAGSAEKLALWRRIGCRHDNQLPRWDFVERVRAAGGADVILDIIGAKYLDRNIDALPRTGGWSSSACRAG
jgi:NADPH:quinone reductase-like Zn-dependent oxidoreductase